MIEQMGTALTTLQLKYRASKLSARVKLKPKLEQLLQDYTDYQLRLIDEGIVTTDEDLAEMEKLKMAIDKAARTQQLAVAIAKTIAFIATKAV
jgi:hypothetical protein